MKNYLFLLLIVLFSFEIYSKENKSLSDASSLMQQSQQLSFIENKGQLEDENGKPTPYVLYKASAPGINIWITTTGITYQFIKGEESKEKNRDSSQDIKEKISFDWNRVDMILKDASIKKENCISENNLENQIGYFNYYLAHCPDGIMDVQSYSKITIKNIYEGIDWVLYTNSENSLKQDFIIHPNANPNQIKIIYEGNGKFEANANQIKFKNDIGELTEGKLFCYQNNQEITSNYIIKKNENITNLGAGNKYQEPTTINQPARPAGGQQTTNLFSYEVSISLTNYDHSKELIIDPQLQWGTFYGGPSSFDGSHQICADNTGNIFIVGYLASTDFPLLDPGAGAYFQNANSGGVAEMFIMKFSNTGAHRWTTYYGGSGDDQGLGVCTDATGNVFITGYTTSSDFPLANPGGGAYFQNTNTNDAVIILKFTNNGNRIWATYYGGANSGEWGRAIATDLAGNVYVTGFTNSSNFPILNLGGAFFQGAPAGFADAFILKFSNTGVRLWATYFGGSANDEGQSINVDIANNIYVTGFTKSTNFPLANPGGGAYYQATYGGGSFASQTSGTGDAFITKFSQAGVLTWSTYYGGSQDEAGHSIKTDKQGNVFAAGITKSPNLPVQNAGGGTYYQGASGSVGLDDAYILRFSSVGVRTWATYYGGNSDESEAAFDSKVNLAIDSCENVYLAFTTKSSNLANKAACDGGFHENTLTGYSDAFISKFSNLGVHHWGTYLGGSGNDFRIAIVTDRNNNLFATGEWTGLVMTNSTYPLVSHGAGSYYDPTHNGDDDVYIVKFRQTTVNATATFTNSNCCTGTATLNGTGGCSPYQYLWYDASWNLVANVQTATNLCGGVYHGVLRDSMSCSLGDTATVTIVEIGTPPNITVGPALVIGCGTSANGIIFASSTTPGVNFSWSGPGIVSGQTNDSAAVNAVGTYTVTITDGNGCSSTGTVTVTSNVTLPNVSPAMTFTITCTILSDTISATSTTPSANYNWNGPGIVSGGTTNIPIVNAAGTYTVIVTDPATGCTNTTTVTVAIDTASPPLTTGNALTIYCNPSQGIIIASSTIGGATFLWSGAGIISGNNNDTATVNATGTYTVTITNPNNGCTKTATVTVTSNTTPPNLTTITPVTVSTCISFTDTITASSTTTNVTYSWAGPGIVSGGNTSSAIINALGTYTVTITDPVTGCTNTATVIVNTSTNLPNITAGPTLTITSCINISGNISASSTTPNVTYSWSGPGIASGGTTSNPGINALGTYTVTVTDPATGCTNTATVTVNSNIVLPVVTTTPATIPCIPQTAIITATSATTGATYSWSGQGIISGNTSASATVNSVGIYTVTITDPITGCTNTATATVSPTPPANANVSPNVTIQLGASTTLTASGGVTYNWFPDTALNTNSGNIVIANPFQTTTYCVEVIDSNGCKDTACVTVTVEIPCPTSQSLMVPNAFSPNKDNINEDFCLEGWTVCLIEFQVVIFDRWGEKVFESKDPNFCWDGYFRGSVMEAQVFVYYIRAEFENMDKPIIKKGNISLIR